MIRRLAPRRHPRVASRTTRTAAIAVALTLASCGTSTIPAPDGRQMSAAIELAIPTTTTTTTTTTAPPPTTVRPKPKVSRGTPRTPLPAAEPASDAQDAPRDIWRALASCESGDGHGSYKPRALSRGGTYRGAFQFSLPTWASVRDADDPIDPIDAPYDVQLRNAQTLKARSGWGQWPRCSRQLGLR
jgi:hypothetical protein